MGNMTNTYMARRQRLTDYFDRTAATAWERLTSDAPVGRVRATVRAGRDRMRDILLGWLPDDMDGMTVLDAGCGTGSLAIIAAERGAAVTAVDVSATLLDVARKRTPEELQDRIHYSAGDMLAAEGGPFDYVVAMDSLIHYEIGDMLDAIAALAGNARSGVLTTFAPRTPLLSIMHFTGRLLPSNEHRAPFIEPASEKKLKEGIDSLPGFADWAAGRTERVNAGFYTSQALELRRV